jgi:hypothetical protein
MKQHCWQTVVEVIVYIIKCYVCLPVRPPVCPSVLGRHVFTNIVYRPFFAPESSLMLTGGQKYRAKGEMSSYLPLTRLSLSIQHTLFVGRFHTLYRPRRPLVSVEVQLYTLFRPRR